MSPPYAYSSSRPASAVAEMFEALVGKAFVSPDRDGVLEAADGPPADIAGL